MVQQSEANEAKLEVFSSKGSMVSVVTSKSDFTISDALQKTRNYSKS